MAALCGVLGMGSLGCAGMGEVRYVYQDGQSGVIGIPENTSRWPTYYRKHAEEMMAKHFPEGYEIVRAEEVVEGSRTLTVNGTRAAELDAKAPSHFVSLGKLGGTSTRTQLDNLKIKECRIVYKKKGGPGAPADHYADQASWTPTTYIDPNAQARQPGGAKADAAKDACPPGTAKPAAETKATKPEQGKGEKIATPPAPSDSKVG